MMRRLVVSMNITMDGFLSAADGGLDWHFQYWDAEMALCLQQQLSNADTILFGANTYRAMAAYWNSCRTEQYLSREDIAFAELLHRYQKVVCSRTLTEVSWNNSKIIGTNAVAAIKKLKADPGKDIILYGSTQLLHTLVRHQLIDEYLLWLHPLSLGRGKRLFQSPAEQTTLSLINTVRFHSGVVLLHYKVQ